jgi:chromosome segregation ATPase
MNPKKPDRNVSNMDVLKEIRGLLSVTHEDVTADGVREENGVIVENAQLKAQIKSYKELVQKQREELQKVENEKKDLTAKLDVLVSAKEESISSVSKSAGLSDETAQLEARIAELSLALSEIDGLIKLRSQELLKKIARVFSEAGQGEVAIEFRKGASELEVVENFAHFLRVLLDQ